MATQKDNFNQYNKYINEELKKAYKQSFSSNVASNFRKRIADTTIEDTNDILGLVNQYKANVDILKNSKREAYNNLVKGYSRSEYGIAKSNLAPYLFGSTEPTSAEELATRINGLDLSSAKDVKLSSLDRRILKPYGISTAEQLANADKVKVAEIAESLRSGSYLNNIEEVNNSFNSIFDDSKYNQLANKTENLANERLNYLVQEAETNRVNGIIDEVADKELSTDSKDAKVKEALNYKVNADGSYTKESKNNISEIKNRVDTARKNIEDEVVNRLSGDEKYKLNEKIDAFVSDKDWRTKFSNMGASEKEELFSGLSEDQRKFVKQKLGLDLDNVGRMTNKEMEKVVKGIANRDDIRFGVGENITNRVNTALETNYKDLNKVLAENGNFSRKTSTAVKAGKYALGALAGAALVGALFFGDNKGEQTNAQLYGQQPLY